MPNPVAIVVVGVVLGAVLCGYGLHLGLDSGGLTYCSIGLCTSLVGLIPYLISRR
jgi:hypothetical protein